MKARRAKTLSARVLEYALGQPDVESAETAAGILTMISEDLHAKLQVTPVILSYAVIVLENAAAGLADMMDAEERAEYERVKGLVGCERYGMRVPMAAATESGGETNEA